jgi:dienelactone hydrolase
MRRSVILLFFIVLIPIVCLSQKKAITHEAYETWTKIFNQQISNNGKFVTYISSTPKYGATLIMQSTDTLWKLSMPVAGNVEITKNSQLIIFVMPGDSLAIIEAGTNKMKFIQNVSSCKFPKNGVTKWIVYQLRNENTVVLLDLFSGRKKTYHGVGDFSFSDNGNVLLLETILPGKVSNSGFFLKAISLSSNKEWTFWQGCAKPEFVVFDKNEHQLCFITKEEGKREGVLWYYLIGSDSASKHIDAFDIGVKERDWALKETIGFGEDGSKIFFTVQKKERLDSPISSRVGVDVWSFKDLRLQSQQLFELESEKYRQYKAVVSVRNKNVILLESENERVIGELNHIVGEYVLIQKEYVDGRENYWQLNLRPSYSIININNGEEKRIAENIIAENVSLSPEGNYVIWYNRSNGNYFVYNIIKGGVSEITKDIKIPLFNDEINLPGNPYPIGIAGWLENDKAILIYDKYDIWRVDPENKKPVVNITNEYGRRNEIFFRYVAERNNLIDDKSVIKSHEKILLSAFDRKNKNNGFFHASTSGKVDPELLLMGPYAYYYPSLPSSKNVYVLSKPIRADKADIYILTRRSDTESPNVFVTRDWKNIIQLSNVQPQKSYNWLKAELVHWTLLDGKVGEGILYKPEDFNPHKKYPVIFNFYEKRSDGLNDFLEPDFSKGPMNIAYFVSNGYLVFDPNIYYDIGNTGESVMNSVVSAAKYMITQPWVDAQKMGLQGHSFGGYEVNYLVSHTTLFTAAATAAGQSDLISGYGGVTGFGVSRAHMYEDNQTRMGGTLWQNALNYIKNSPIMQADKVSTPLLIMHNKEDDAVPFSQSVEWFTALRRLGKRVWLLQYDGEGHSIGTEDNKLDYSIRLTQFFNYYLKDSLPPKWMTRGIPANLKGIEDGLQLDSCRELR